MAAPLKSGPIPIPQAKRIWDSCNVSWPSIDLTVGTCPAFGNRYFAYIRMGSLDDEGVRLLETNAYCTRKEAWDKLDSMLFDQACRHLSTETKGQIHPDQFEIHVPYDKVRDRSLIRSKRSLVNNGKEGPAQVEEVMIQFEERPATIFTLVNRQKPWRKS